MKLFSNSLLFLFVIFFFENSAYSMSDYRIREFCQNKPRKSNCIKDLKFKKLNLIEGKKIEIPVIPFKKWLYIYISNSDSKAKKALLYWSIKLSEFSLKPIDS